MNRLIPSLLALSAIATTGLCHLGFPLRSAHAAASLASSLNVESSGTSAPHHSALGSGVNQPVLIARRLGFRWGVRASRYRRGGFSRGASCPSNSGLIAVVPEVESADVPENERKAPVYLTASAHPMFFFHIPSLPTTTGRLTLRRADVPLTQGTSYEMDFELTGESGIVGVQLSDSTLSLESGIEYLWQVSVACEPGNFANSLTINGGVVERVADTTGTPSERLNFYMNQGIWQDTVSLMAEGVYTNPLDAAIARQFSSLLEEAGLGAIAQAPVVQIIEGQ